MPHEQAVAIIEQTRGKHFDPDVVDAFLEIQDAFNAIAIAYSDTQADLLLKAQYIKNAAVPSA
jgi:putative two-component system response regulator